MNARTPSIIDASAWVGSYPFRGIVHSSLDDLETKAAELNIERVVVSSFENLFQQNGLNAFHRWQETLAGRPRLEHWPVVNPAMPGELRRLERIETRGARLTSNYHGYRLTDACVDDVMAMARERDMVVQPFACIADYRWHFMLKVANVPQDELIAFVRKHASARLLISGVVNLPPLAEAVKAGARTCVDLSRMRGPVLAVEKLLKLFPSERLVFGTLWPIQVIEATLWQVTESKVEPAVLTRILRDNFKSLVRQAI